jgi:CheY-like chemotaxis protein
VEASGHKVLVVDDERTIADTLAVIFSQRGFDARPAYSAEQALEIVDEWPPDLAILDVILPQMNGIDRSILPSERLPKCRSLLFSGQALTADLLASAEKRLHIRHSREARASLLAVGSRCKGAHR